MKVKNLFLGDVYLLTSTEYSGYGFETISNYSLQRSAIFYKSTENSEIAKDIKDGNNYRIKNPYMAKEGEKFVLKEKESEVDYDEVSALDYSFIRNELDHKGYTRKHISKRKVLELLGPSVDSVNAYYNKKGY